MSREGEVVERGGFHVKQNGVVVAGGSGPYEAIKREAQHYAMVYRQEGPVTVRFWRNGKRSKRGTNPAPLLDEGGAGG